MKRFLTLFLSLILSLSFFTFVGCKPDNNNNDNGDHVPPSEAPIIYDYDFTDGKWAYFLSEDNTYLSILYVGGDVDELTVPTSYNGIPVTTIKSEAFLGVKIGVLTILDNITTIEDFSMTSHTVIDKLIIEYPEVYDHGYGLYTSVTIKLFEPRGNVENLNFKPLWSPGGRVSPRNSIKKAIIPKETKSLTYKYCTNSILFYKGTMDDFNKIEVPDSGGLPSNLFNVACEVYYYSEVEPELNTDGTAYDGKYWRYVNNEPVIWEYTPSN